MNKVVLLSNSNIHEDYAFSSLKHLIKPGMKVLAFAYASQIDWQMDNQDSLVRGLERVEMYKPFREYGIEIEDFIVAPFPRVNQISYIKMKLERADIIFFRGGYMENIKFLLNVVGLWEFIQQLDNKLFIGASAGALILEDYYQVTPFVEKHYDSYNKVKGLGIDKEFSVLVHYNPRKILHRINLLFASLGNPKKIVRGLGENGGVIITEKGHEFIGDTYKLI